MKQKRYEQLVYDELMNFILWFWSEDKERKRPLNGLEEYNRLGNYNELERGKMKLKIFEENKDKQIYLKLFENKDCIKLNVVDKEGSQIDFGHLLSMSNKGIVLHSHINPKFGLELDEDGKINIDD